MSNRRVFTRECKLAAIKKIIEQGLNYVESAREMSISDSALRAWKKEFELNGTLQNQLSQSPGNEHLICSK
jgi:transposase-like protein